MPRTDFPHGFLLLLCSSALRRISTFVGVIA
jgi:hypothetical protein